MKADSYEGYTIANWEHQVWLPDAAEPASEGGAVGAVAPADTSDTEQRFLFEEPTAETSSPVAASPQGSTVETPTIAPSELKKQIADLKKEVDAGSGQTEYTPEEYKWCVFYKYEKKRKVRHKIDRDGEYYYLRHDNSLGAGLAAGAIVFKGMWADLWLSQYEKNEQRFYGELWIGNGDSALFTSEWSGFVRTVCPLPAGEYKLNFAEIHGDYAICDAFPDEEKKREELFVTVTASAATVHEAFFDPVAIGTGVGEDATNGQLSPTEFAVGGATAGLQSLRWQGNSVVLTLSPYAALTGKAIDVIALDGTVSLTLAVDSATVDSVAETLT